MADLHEITEIYNHAILKTTSTFDTEPKTMASQIHWFHAHGDHHPITVAKLNGRVVAWACLSPWSPKKAYAHTVEISTYVHHHFQGQGIGREITQDLIGKALTLEHHSLIARIANSNQASFGLYESLGFQKIGIMKEVGHKFNEWIDVHLYQRILS